MLVQPFQAQARGGVAAGTEGQARIDDECLAVAGLGFGSVPAGQDQQALAHRDRVELGLGEAHPVLIVHAAGAHDVGQSLFQAVGGFLQHGQICWGRGVTRVGVFVRGVQQHGQPGSLPAEGLGQVARTGAGQARGNGLTEQGLLVGRVGVGVFGLDRQGPGFQQGVGPVFGLGLVDFECDFDPGLAHGMVSASGRSG